MVPTKSANVESYYQGGVYHTNGLYYQGKLVKYQTEGKTYRGKRYTRFEHDPFTDYQNFMYRRALYGLKALPEEDVKYMHWEKKRRITKISKRTRKAINVLKQEIIIRHTNSILSGLHKSALVRGLIENFSGTSPDVESKFTLKELGLTKVDVANRLIELRILPRNFYELKKDPNARHRLPRFKQPANSVPVSG